MKDNIFVLLSIIVPIYNTEKFLNKCIESILAQTYERYELILVDDGSTDGSLTICNYYARQDNRIRVIHKKNEGVTSARKAGLSLAQGEYVSFIDSDDWIESKFYAVFLDRCQNIKPDIIIASGYKSEEYSDAGVRCQKIHIPLENGIYHRKDIVQILKKRKLIPALWLKLFKRELIERNMSLVDNRVCIGEDELCTYACALDADTIIIQRNCQYHYVQHESSAMHRKDGKYVDSTAFFSQNVKKLRDIKRADFMDLQWNRMVLTKLLNAIRKEYGKYGCILDKKELAEIERMFRSMELTHLLIKHEYKTAINEKKADERLILRLYSLKYYRMLGLWIKLYEMKSV